MSFLWVRYVGVRWLFLFMNDFGIYLPTNPPTYLMQANREENNLMVINLVTLKVQIIYEYDFDAHLSQMTYPISQPASQQSQQHAS